MLSYFTDIFTADKNILVPGETHVENVFTGMKCRHFTLFKNE